MRVYVPATLAGLAAYVRSGTVPSIAERFTAVVESEEAEYDALTEAAEAAAALLDEPGRRVVIVADLADEDAAFGMEQIDAVHADTDDIDPAGDPDALPDLGWFAAQEIDDLIG
jgi:hypothetical protein